MTVLQPVRPTPPPVPPMAIGSRLNVCVDARGLEAPVWRGWQVYAYQSIKALADHDSTMSLHVQIRGREVPPRLAELTRRNNIRVHPVGGQKRAHIASPWCARRMRCKVYWRCFNEFRPIYVPTGCRNVITVHDLQHVLRDNEGRQRQAPIVPRSWSFARRWIHHIVTVSEATRRDIVKHLNWDESRTTIVPNGFEQPARPAALPEGFNAEPPFLLAVNLANPYKNWRQLIEAYESFIRGDGSPPPLRLVIAGALHSQQQPLEAYLRERPELARSVELPGYLPEQALHGLYSNCAAFISLSRYEGFGRPLVEAAAFGAPVIASDIPAHREVAGPGTRFVPLDDVAATARAIRAAVAESAPADGRPFIGYPPAYRWPAVAEILSRCLRAQARPA